MTPEEVKKIKCDRCGVIVGLYRHSKGWRCPQCIWNERENLIEWSKIILNAYRSIAKTIPYKDIRTLAEVIKEVTS